MKNSAFKSSILVILLLSGLKLLGFIKQVTIAACFGAELETDIFFLSSNFSTLVVFGLFSSLTVTLVIYYINEKNISAKRASELVSRILTAAIPASILLTVIIILFAKPIAVVLAPTYTEKARFDLMLSIRTLSIIYVFYAISSIFSTVLDAEKHFLKSKASSAFYSISVIACILIFSHNYGVKSLYLGFIIYLPITCIYQVIILHKNIKIQILNPIGDERIKKVLVDTIPVFLGNTMIELNSIVDNMVASSLAEGAISALSYSQTLWQFVTGIVVTGFGSVLFCYFTDYIAKKNYNLVITTLEKSLGAMIIVLIPITIVTIICKEDIVGIVFMRGVFSAEALKMSSLALLGYGVGFCFFGVRELLIKAIYAYGDTKAPMKNSIISIFVNVILSLSLSQMLGIFGISISTSIASLVGMLLSVITLKRHIPQFSFKRLTKRAAKPIVCGAVAASVTILVHHQLVFSSSLLRFILTIAVCGIIYFVALLLMQDEDVKYILDRVRR